MSRPDGRLHVAFASDEVYAVGLAAAVQSVLESLHNFNRPATIWIVDFGLTAQSRRWLLRLLDAFPTLQQPQDDHCSSTGLPTVTIELIHPTKDYLGKISKLPAATGYASAVTWAKLFLPCLLAPTARDHQGLLLYLDSDVIVTPDTDLGQIRSQYLEKIAQHPGQQPALAAVIDFGLPAGHPALRDLGWGNKPLTGASTPVIAAAAAAAIEPGPKYFNAGVLLLHMPSYEHRVLLKVVQLLDLQSTSSSSSSSDASRLISDYAPVAAGPGGIANAEGLLNKLKYADQDTLNLMCQYPDDWLELDFKWNVQGIGSYLKDRCQDFGPDRPGLLTAEEAAELEACPGIIHFTGTPKLKPSELLNPWVKVPTKPWAFISTHPYKGMFYQFLNKTPWQGITAEQGDLESTTVEELLYLAEWVEERCGRDAAAAPPAAAVTSTDTSHGLLAVSCSSRFNRQQFFRSLGLSVSDSTAAANNASPAASSTTTQDDLHSVFKAFKDPANPSLVLAGIPLDPSAGFSFTDVWFDPHAPSWESNVVAVLLPQGIGSRAVRVLEIGLWEGRSTCYMLLTLAKHAGSKVVCIDPFDKLYPQFERNRFSWLINVAAAGGLGSAAAEVVRSEAAAAPAAVGTAAPGLAAALDQPQDAVELNLGEPFDMPEAGPTAAAAETLKAAQYVCSTGPADGPLPATQPKPLPTDVLLALYATAVSGTAKVQLMHESSTTALPRLLLNDQQPTAGRSDDSNGGSTAPPAADTRHIPAGSQNTSPEAPQQFDLIYVDGSHMRVDVLMDAVLAWPLVLPGGLMVFDDYEWDVYRDNPVCHPKEGIDAFLEVHAHQLDIIHKSYQVIVRKKAGQ